MRLQPFVLLLTLLACGWFGAAQAEPERGQPLYAQFQPRPQWWNRSRVVPQEAPGTTAMRPPRRPATWQEQQAEQLYRTGRAYIEQGFYGEGLDALNQALALRPNYDLALTWKGIALRRMREPQLALEQFDQALAVDPANGVAHGERGLTYIELGQLAKADEDLRAAARYRPDLTPWFNQQSQQLASMAPPGGRQTARAPQAAPAEPEETPSPTATPEPPPEAPRPDGETEAAAAGSQSSRPLIDWAGARALVQPGLVLALLLLALLLGLRVLFFLAGRVLRRLFRPWSPRRRPEPEHAFRRETMAMAPYAGPDPGAPAVGRRPLFRTLFRNLFRGFFRLAAIGFVVALLCALPVLVEAFRLDADKLTAPRVRPTVLDSRGNVYTQLGTPDSPIKFSDLPVNLVDALRAREDSRFFEHHGVDWLGLARALVVDLRHGRIKQGASTLTMQLVEKAYDLDQKGALNRVRSKLVEWTLAHRGEAALVRRLGDRRAAKEAIMAAYLNRVEFGSGTVGVGAASQFYFDKPVSKLTLGESCMLVALLRAPTANSPYRNPENSRMARDFIVAQMLRRGFITEDQAKQARFHVVKNPKKPQAKHNGYLVAAITREMNALKAQGKLPADLWDHENLSIHSTLDLWAQEILDAEIRKVCSSFSGDTKEDPLGGAGMIMDNATGEVRALVSGQDYTKNQFDLAFTSRRQVASIAKPFVYGAYVEAGGDITETVSNGPLSADEIRALDNWNPGNSSSLKAGTYPLSTGLAFSDNSMTVRVGLNAELQRVYETLFRAGLVSDKATTGPTWLLGTFDCSLANVVSAYSAFPRGGTRVTPHLVQSVEIEGKEVYRAEPRQAPLFAERTCRQLHRGLREAMTDGTGRTAVRNAGLDASVAGKTGTSQNAADVWWVGYVKDVTLGVRFGRTSNASLGDAAAGGTMAAPVAARVLKKLSERYTVKDVAAEGTEE